MIDIHCHLLYGLDDGARNLEESKAMLEIARDQQISALIVTPHCRRGMFRYDIGIVDKHFKVLKEYADALDIDIYPGTEYHVNDDIVDDIKNGLVHTLADGKYVLTEYSHTTEVSYMKWMTRDLIYNGYKPVIAHAERYPSLVEDIDYIYELKNLGALIQVNADSILGLDGRHIKKFCKQALKEELVDVVASDSHSTKERACHMAECYTHLVKNYGEQVAYELMQKNPKTIVLGK